jgi:hypothetical protein
MISLSEIEKLKKRYNSRNGTSGVQLVFKCVTGYAHPRIPKKTNDPVYFDYLFGCMRDFLTPLDSVPDPIDKSKVYVVKYGNRQIPYFQYLTIQAGFVFDGRHKFRYHNTTFYSNQQWFEVNFVGHTPFYLLESTGCYIPPFPNV